MSVLYTHTHTYKCAQLNVHICQCALPMSNLSLPIRTSRLCGSQFALFWAPRWKTVPSWTYQEVDAVPLPVSEILVWYQVTQTHTHAYSHTCVLSKGTLLTPLWKGGGVFLNLFQERRYTYVGKRSVCMSLCVCDCVCVRVRACAKVNCVLSHWVMAAGKTGKQTTIHYSVGVWRLRKNVCLKQQHSSDMMFIRCYWFSAHKHPMSCDIL